MHVHPVGVFRGASQVLEGGIFFQKHDDGPALASACFAEIAWADEERSERDMFGGL